MGFRVGRPEARGRGGLKALRMDRPCPFCGQPVEQKVLSAWEGMGDLLVTLKQLGADDFLDPHYWRRIDQLTKGTEVFYDWALRKYLAWWESKPVSLRHRNRRRGFMNWIKQDLAREDWRKNRAPKFRT